MSVESIGKVAFDVIYEDNVEIVYKVAAKYCGNHHTAEEIAQSVFMKLYMNMDHVNLDAVRPWLVLTTKYMALNVIEIGNVKFWLMSCYMKSMKRHHPILMTVQRTYLSEN